MIHALGAMPLNVITANTLQTPNGVLSAHYTDPDLIGQQLQALLQAYPVGALKIGMLGTAAAVNRVAAVLAACPPVFVVLDPVLRASGGARLLDEPGLEALNTTLMPHVDLLTPNLDESGAVLPGVQTAVLVKGGHQAGDACSDVLLAADGSEQTFTEARIQTRNSRGTGCSLSAGIAAGIAQGLELRPAYLQARHYLMQSLRRNASRDYVGDGPAFVNASAADASA